MWLSRISIALVIVGAVGFVTASDLIWHRLPDTLDYVAGLGFWFGVGLSFLAVIAAVCSRVTSGPTSLSY
jgi:multisubunit Na+/H+ antiporter MnhG subunit